MNYYNCLVFLNLKHINFNVNKLCHLIQIVVLGQDMLHHKKL